MTKNERFRLRIIVGFIVLFGVLAVTRLYMLQIVHSSDFREEGERQYVATDTNIFDRGSIYFTQKDGKLVAAATLNEGYIVSITPKAINDPERTYAEISRIITLDKEEFMAKAAKHSDPYEEIATRVPEGEARAIRALKIEGIQTFREAWRYYPGGSLSAQAIGFVAYEDDRLTGRYGLESYYNDTLSRAKQNLYVNFFAELFANLSATIFDRTSEEEGDLVLTIEPTVAHALEDELDRVMADWDSDQAGGIIMDPSTGAIYAISVRPTFDLNNYGKVKSARVYANPIVQDVREMGSIVKPLTMAAGLDAGVVTAETTYNDVGAVTYNRKTISNYDGRGRGPGTTMQKVLDNSLNTGAAFVEQKLGNELFADYMLNKFHMGDETGIDLPGERQGLMSNLASTRDIEYVTASFGQGIAVTPINMTAALATLGNGGYTVTPHVVDEIRYESGRVKKVTGTPPEQVLKEATSDEITRMLVSVVDHALLGGTVKIPEYSVAAKTGTAQLARPAAEGGGYYDDRYLHTFFGYFPAYDPKFIVFLYTYYPKNGATFASNTLTLPFIRLTKFLLNYYNVPPDRSALPQGISLVDDAR